jgi:hypothetical protein
MTRAAAEREHQDVTGRMARRLEDQIPLMLQCQQADGIEGGGANAQRRLQLRRQAQGR